MTTQPITLPTIDAPSDARLRARYPLLIHPDHIGSEEPLDPIEARACRRIRASEVAAFLPLADVERIADLAGSEPVRSLYDVAETLDPLCMQMPGVWIGSVAVDADAAHNHERESAGDLARVTTSAELAAWCDAWLIVHAWVCEGDEPASAIATSSPASRPEPPPNAGPAIWPLVCADLRCEFSDVEALCAEAMGRDAFGRAKYGTPLQANNGRDPLVDAFQEALDLAVYLRQAQVEDVDDVRSHYQAALRLVVGLYRILAKRAAGGGGSHEPPQTEVDDH